MTVISGVLSNLCYKLHLLTKLLISGTLCVITVFTAILTSWQVTELVMQVSTLRCQQYLHRYITHEHKLNARIAKNSRISIF